MSPAFHGGVWNISSLHPVQWAACKMQEIASAYAFSQKAQSCL